MLSTIDYNRNCTGCGACAYVCHKQAITFQRDKGGFLYPVVNQQKCVKCGKCLSACHYVAPITLTRLRAFYGFHKDSSIRASSSSGGVFTGIAQSILKSGGVVYGHVMDYETFHVSYSRAKNEDDLISQRQSKYVESDITGIYEDLRKDLADKPVLFCGTPCQCAAIRRSFPESDNLYLVSFICHGVGSPKLFSDHYQNICNGKNVKEFRMRDKSYGWHDNAIYIGFDSHHRHYLAHYSVDSYYYGYIALNMFLRDACYACKYTAGHCSDVTLGDFWGIGVSSYEDDNKGLSLVITNTEKGNVLVDNLEKVYLNKIEVNECDYAFFPGMDPDDNAVSEMIRRKIEFLDLSYEKGFEEAAKGYMDNMTLRKVKVFIKKIAKTIREH